MSKVLIVGLGYVGLPIAVRAAEVGHEVVGADTSREKVNLLRRQESYVGDIPDDRLRAVAASLSVVHTSEPIPTFDIALIAVPTPVSDLKRPDLTYIEAASKYVAQGLRPDGILVLESTTYPGTTEDVVARIVEDETGMVPGTDYHLGFSPERINPGDKVHTFETTPKIVSGTDEQALAAIQGFYDSIVSTTVPVSSPRAAEMAKIFENTFANVNIALVNEVSLICADLGIDVDEVLDAAATKGHAIMRFQPGLGTGGHSAAPGTLVLTEHGMRPIEDIQNGDRVVASDGRLHAVLMAHSHEYDGAMVVVRSRGMPEVRLTTEHKIPVATDKRRIDTRKAGVTRQGHRRRGPERAAWTEYLAEGEVLPKGLSAPEFIEASTIAPKHHWMYWPTVAEDSSIVVPEWASEEYIRLAGWYASEGTTSWADGVCSSVSFGLHTDEVGYQEEVAALLGSVTGGHHVGSAVYPDSHSHVVRTYAPSIARRLVQDFGRYQHDRVVPSWLLYGPEKNIGLFLRGLFCGDAWLSDAEAQLSTTSQDLAYGAVVLLNRLGITARVKERRRKDRRLAFEVIVRGSSALSEFYTVIDAGVIARDIADPVMYPKRDGKRYRRVSSVHMEHYAGTVYDITVDEDHTFVTPAGVVSNCLPVDSLYLAWLRRYHHGKVFKFAELADEINSYMPTHASQRIREILGDRQVSVWKSHILVLGVAYKPGVADVRESPSQTLITRLREDGADVTVVDPHVQLDAPETAGKIADEFDLVVIATAHPEFDYELIQQKAAAVFDPRNMYPAGTPKVYKP